MPNYIYGCKNKSHPEIETYHGFEDNPEIICEVCGSVMHRIPQSFTFYNSPWLTLRDKMENNFRNYKKRKEINHAR